MTIRNPIGVPDEGEPEPLQGCMIVADLSATGRVLISFATPTGSRKFRTTLGDLAGLGAYFAAMANGIHEGLNTRPAPH